MKKELVETLTKVANGANENKSTILTVFAVVGVAGTALLTAYGSIRAKQHIEEANGKVTKDTVKKLAIDLAPAAVVATGTIACVILAHKADAAKYAALAAIYAKDSKTVNSIVSKVKIDKDGNITIDKDDKKADILIDDEGHVLDKNGDFINEESLGNIRVFDKYTGQWYDCTITDIRRAIKCTNDELLSASSNFAIGVYAADTFYNDMERYLHNSGISRPDLLGGMGWTADDGAVEVEFGAELDDNLRPYYTIDFVTRPHNIDEPGTGWKRY